MQASSNIFTSSINPNKHINIRGSRNLSSSSDYLAIKRFRIESYVHRFRISRLDIYDRIHDIRADICALFTNSASFALNHNRVDYMRLVCVWCRAFKGFLTISFGKIVFWHRRSVFCVFSSSIYIRQRPIHKKVHMNRNILFSYFNWFCNRLHIWKHNQ